MTCRDNALSCGLDISNISVTTKDTGVFFC